MNLVWKRHGNLVEGWDGFWPPLRPYTIDPRWMGLRRGYKVRCYFRNARKSTVVETVEEGKAWAQKHFEAYVNRPRPWD